MTAPVLAAADVLSPYAVATRYPGDSELVTNDEHAEALRAASDIVKWAQSLLPELIDEDG